MRIVRFARVFAFGAACFASAAGAQVTCVESGRRDPSDPDLVLEREAFGFHDEEVVICSAGYAAPTHLAARLWVPDGCEAPGACPAVLIAHGFAFTKELTFADMQNAASRGMVVFSYDVRGHGASGGQVGFMGREEIADQAAVLDWLERHVAPAKTGVYGVSQGGAHAVMAAVFNCSAARSAEFLAGDDFPDASCDGGRRVHAIVPVQAPTSLDGDGTCSSFAIQAVPQSRFSPALTREALRCATIDTPLAGAAIAATEPLPALDLTINDTLSRAASIDVPAYLVTSFFDRLVLPQNVTRLYEALDARGDYGEDLRLIVSNDGHGAVGGNFAVLNDVFAWLARVLGADPAPLDAPPLRAAPVALAQEWEGNAFRLEEAWPIPGSASAAACLFRGGGDPFAAGEILPCDVAEGADEMQNVPLASSPPDVPFLDFLGPITAATGGSWVPGSRLVYASAPLAETTEVTGLPEVSLWLSSSNPEGKAQVHVALAEITPAGEISEFARNRRGLRGLGTAPAEVRFPLTVSAHRIDAGNRLLLTVSPNDPGESVPYLATDTTRIHYGGSFASKVTVPTVPVGRTPPPGDPPSGPGFPDNALGAICQAFGQDC